MFLAVTETARLKRLSNKSAERERRDKLKDALDKLATYMSKGCCDEWSTGPLRSKVAVIECAIDYIVCIQARMHGEKTSD